jgi:hypothetical protein
MASATPRTESVVKASKVARWGGRPGNGPGSSLFVSCRGQSARQLPAGAYSAVPRAYATPQAEALALASQRLRHGICHVLGRCQLAP